MVVGCGGTVPTFVARGVDGRGAAVCAFAGGSGVTCGLAVFAAGTTAGRAGSTRGTGVGFGVVTTAGWTGAATRGAIVGVSMVFAIGGVAVRGAIVGVWTVFALGDGDVRERASVIPAMVATTTMATMPAATATIGIPARG